jgi:hypothetical protein
MNSWNSMRRAARPLAPQPESAPPRSNEHAASGPEPPLQRRMNLRHLFRPRLATLKGHRAGKKL